VTSLLIDFRINVTRLDSAWHHGSIHETSMTETLKSKNWEFVGLRLVNIDLLMPVRLSTSANSQKSIKFTVKGQSRHIKVKLGCSIILNTSSVSKQNRASQNHTTNLVTFAFSIDLSHDASERMSSQVVLSTWEALLL